MIIIDAGHGGWDPGGGSNNYFKEKDLTLKISEYQNKRLNDLGISNKLVRNTDETLTPSERIDRIESLSTNSDDILISNHINTGNDQGGEIIYSIRSKNVLPQKISENLQDVGLKIRNVYQRVLSSGNDYYFILRDTLFQNAMIIEYGFASNENDTTLLLYDWPKLAEAVVKALAEYLNISYTKPNYIIHIVKPNESLFKISQMYNTTIERIKEINNLTNDTIYPLMELYIE